MITLRANSDGDLKVTNLINEDTGAVISDATVTCALYDSVGVLIGGSSVSLPAIGGVPGGYGGNLPYTVVLTKGQRGTARFLVIKAPYRSQREVDFTVVVD